MKQLLRINMNSPVFFPTSTHVFPSFDQERGAEKERRIAAELMQKQLEEERARIPRAHPYPYTTDFPVV